MRVFETRFGRAVTFVQPAGLSLMEMAELLNAESQRLFRHNVIMLGSARTALMRDDESSILPATSQNHCLVPLVRGTRSLDKTQQLAFIVHLGLFEVRSSAIGIAAGLFHLKHGFPEDAIGRPSDKGDLFKGMHSRGIVGLAKTEGDGVIFSLHLGAPVSRRFYKAGGLTADMLAQELCA